MGCEKSYGYWGLVIAYRGLNTFVPPDISDVFNMVLTIQVGQ